MHCVAQPMAAFHFYHMGARLHDTSGIAHSILTAGVGHKRQVANNEGFLIAAPHRFDVVKHVVHSDGDGGIKPQYRHT